MILDMLYSRVLFEILQGLASILPFLLESSGAKLLAAIGERQLGASAHTACNHLSSELTDLTINNLSVSLKHMHAFKILRKIIVE